MLNLFYSIFHTVFKIDLIVVCAILLMSVNSKLVSTFPSPSVDLKILHHLFCLPSGTSEF